MAVSANETAVEATVAKSPKTDIASMFEACLDHQTAAFRADPVPDHEQRKSDLLTLKRMLSENRDAIVSAISKDYGSRSRHESLFADIISVTDGINDHIKHLRKWMRPQRRHVDLTMFPGGRNRVIPQPLGVVGIIVPWNFPVNLAFMPLAAAFAAGNRAMVKMSENSRTLTKLLQELCKNYFADDKLVFFEETGGVGIEFSKLPFNLIVFTGSGETGKAVMAAAAKNLCPVILELGGKSPAIIDPAYPLEKAVQRIMYVKQFNSGQICTNVDYVFVHQSQRDEFVDLTKAYVAEHVPDIEHEDYTSIIDDQSFDRLLETLEDAREKGGTVVNLSVAQEANAKTRKMPLFLILDPTEDMHISTRETFGPILMVLIYRDPQEIIDYITERDRPLALYPFSNDKALVHRYIDHIMSGGVTVNDALFHVAQHDMPFGGVGASGMGHYHGYEGFVSFSKLRPVFYQAGFSAFKFLQPPYGKLADRVLDFMASNKS